MNKKATEDNLTRIIIELIEEKKPESVKQLAALVKERAGLSEKKIIDQILHLQNEGTISFRKPPQPTVHKLSVYLRSENVYWY